MENKSHQQVLPPGFASLVDVWETPVVTSNTYMCFRCCTIFNMLSIFFKTFPMEPFNR